MVSHPNNIFFDLKQRTVQGYIQKLAARQIFMTILLFFRLYVIVHALSFKCPVIVILF